MTTYGCFPTNETVGVIIKQLNVSGLGCSRFPTWCAKIYPFQNKNCVGKKDKGL